MDTNEMILQYQQTRDLRVRNEIIMNNVKFIRYIARRYRREDDVLSSIHDGVIGMIRAIETYDPNKGSFSTYSKYWISSAILSETYRYLSVVKVGTTQTERLILSNRKRMSDPRIPNRYKNAVRRVYKRTVSLSEGSKEDFYNEMRIPMLNGEPCPVDWNVGQGMTLSRECMGNSIVSKEVGPEEALLRKEIGCVLGNLLRDSNLDERELDIIKLIKDGKSMAPLAEKYGVTRQRISQIKDRLLCRLRREVAEMI